MRTLIVGAGDLGVNIAHHLVMENHNVVMIDPAHDRLELVSDQLDVQTITGLGCHPDVLEQAGCADADMIIAVAGSDEVNMVACQMAYTLFKVPKKIARVRDPSYLKLTSGHLFTPENMPVDVVISPETEVAESIIHTLDVPGAFDATVFAGGDISVIGLKMLPNSPVLGVPFKKLTTTGELRFVVVALYRDGRVLVPGGNDHIEQGDELYLVCPEREKHEVMAYLGFENRHKARQAFVIGGGNIGFEVCKYLEKRGLRSKVLERDSARAAYLAGHLSETVVLNGNAIDKELLLQEGVAQADLVLAVTNDDAVNILSSVLAQQLGAKSVVTRINKSGFMPLIDSIKLPKVISPLEITSSRILQHVRRGQIESLYTLHEGRAQMVEAVVSYQSALCGRRIGDVSLPDGVRIGAVYHPQKGMVLPRHDTVMHVGDRVILFATVEKISDVDALF